LRFGPPANFSILARQQGIERERLKSTCGARSDEKAVLANILLTRRIGQLS
jgi:hypothetical protein